MKKIMFNDRYGQTDAVLNGTKTLSHRLIKEQSGELLGTYKYARDGVGLMRICARFANTYPDAPYAIGEIVAVAQSYLDIVKSDTHFQTALVGNDILGSEPARNNKMFVKADLMPHQIRTLDIKAERLQDITNKDCLRSGIIYLEDLRTYYFEDKVRDCGFYFNNPREAFATLINKINGSGTWERNPYVWRIEFELSK